MIDLDHILRGAATDPRQLTPEQRVARGASYFDAEFPGWVERVDLATLDMGHRRHCILGQVAGDYMFADGTPLENIGRGFKAIPFGLSDGLAAAKAADAAALDVEWRRVVLARRGAVV